MAVENFESPFAIIVNLDAYTGNFERPFCAYVTGAVGECGVGDNMSELFFEEEGEDNYLADLTDHVGDEYGCHRPVSIYDDGDHYESLIIFLQDEPSPEEWELIVRRAKKFCAERPDHRSYMGEKKPYTLKGIRLISNTVVRHQETLKQETF